MTSPVLYYYIKNTLAAGKTKEDISAILEHQGGWTKEDLTQAFLDVVKGNTPNTAADILGEHQRRKKPLEILSHAFAAFLVLLLLGIGAYYYKITHDKTVVSGEGFSFVLPQKFARLRAVTEGDFVSLPNKTEFGFSGGISSDGCSEETDNPRLLFSCVRYDGQKIPLVFMAVTDTTLDADGVALSTPSERAAYINKIKIALQITQPASIQDIRYDDVTHNGELGLMVTMRTAERGRTETQRIFHVVKGGQVIAFQLIGAEGTINAVWPYIEQSIWSNPMF